MPNELVGKLLMIVDELRNSLKPDVTPISHPRLDRHGVKVFMARLDCIVPFASGNKIYKLVGNLDKALQIGRQSLLSFGGAYSNHIHALALTADKYGFNSIGIIRGEEVVDNPTLSDARKAGMTLETIDRQTYRRRYNADYLNELQQRFPDALIIPEGGANKDSLIGVGWLPRLIEDEVSSSPHTICCAAGTGATAAGLAKNLRDSQSLRVYSVVRDASTLERMDQLSGMPLAGGFSMTDASYSGYAKLDKEHIQFVLDWLNQTGVLLDPIYTAKLCRKVIEEVEAGKIKSGARIILIHSGGLQGWRGYQAKVERLVGVPAWQQIASCL